MTNYYIYDILLNRIVNLFIRGYGITPACEEVKMKKIISLIVIVGLLTIGTQPVFAKLNINRDTDLKKETITLSEEKNQEKKKWHHMTKSEKGDKVVEVIGDVGFVVLAIGLVAMPYLLLTGQGRDKECK